VRTVQKVMIFYSDGTFEERWLLLGSYW
jgi:hypothetical protein